MTQSLFTKTIGAAFLMAAALALAGCGQSSPGGSETASNTGHDEGDGHDHGKESPGTRDHSGWWCAEHGIPEAECSQCDSKVAAEFQQKGDWCKEHDRAHSQCFLCDPKAKERYAAIYKAKNGTDPPAIESESASGEAKSKG